MAQEIKYLNRSSSGVDPYALGPDGPVDNPFENDEEVG